MSILVRYANFYVKNLRKNNDKMTQFHWSRKSRDSCPTSSAVCAIFVCLRKISKFNAALPTVRKSKMGWLRCEIIYVAVVLHLLRYTVSSLPHTINVTMNGSNDYMNCSTLTQGCTLTSAFRAVAVQEKFKNSTTIRISAGNYTLNTSFKFENTESLTITGLPGHIDNNVSIQCSGNASGLAFIKCRNTSIQDVSLISCGVLHNSSSYNTPLFYSALFVKENTNLRLQYVVIEKSIGIGLTIFDTAGDVVINSVNFLNNGPKSLKCELWDSVNNKTKLGNIVNAGGGLYIEFTYMYDKSDENDNLKNNNYYILQSVFKGNTAPYSQLQNATFIRPSGIKHSGFSRGGGLSIYIRGSAENNNFFIDSCNFEDNKAVWGGGYFIQFLDSASGNNVTIHNTNVTQNMACFGGGAFQLSIILSLNKSDTHFAPNNILSTFCIFSKNSAVSGGGGAIFGRSTFGYVDDSYSFDHCKWESNEATIGFALTLKLSDYDQGLFGPNSPFKIKLSHCDIHGNTLRDASKYGWGIGTVYDFLIPLVLKNVNFSMNTNTSLVLDTSSVQICENVTFIRNTGYKGGAVAMYGEASFHLNKGSRLTFDGNDASEVGGAIFVETPGPDSIPIVTNNYLQTHECFFKYEDPSVHPDYWQTEVIFIENKAPLAAGYSIYTNSLRDCLHANEGIPEVLEWKSFYYYPRNTSNSTEQRRFEIVTDAVNISSKKSDWSVPPAQPFSPHVTLLDEKNNSVYGMIRIDINTEGSSPVKLGTPSSLFLVKDKIPFLDLQGESGTNFSVNFRTVGGQFVEKTLENVELKICSPGFVLQENKCVCASINKIQGVSRCNEENTEVYLEKGYWAGVVQDSNGKTVFVTAQCPTGYCNCPRSNNYSIRTDECVYKQDEICDGNRMGVMCGSCKSGYTVLVGNQDCSADCRNSDLWRLGLLLLSLTVLVVVIFVINFDIFTCYLNVWLYFYQVVNLVTGVHEDIAFDPFIGFIIGLAQININGFGSCFWEGMDNLVKLGFSYVLPVYVFVVVFVISVIARTFPNSYFTRNTTFRASCTLFVLCYSTLAKVSMDILRPSKVGDKIVVFYQGTETYFGSYHSYFAVPALLILFLIVIPFPCSLMFTQFFINHVRLFNYAIPLFNTFQSCFKVGCKWYAGFYFFSRCAFLVFATFIPYGTVKALFMQISCLLVLIVHVLYWPYSEEYNWVNRVDGVLLTTLTIISIIAGQVTINISIDAQNNMMKIIDSFTYIPLVYVLGFAIYLLHKLIKQKLHLRRPTTNLQNFDNVHVSERLT